MINSGTRLPTDHEINQFQNNSCYKSFCPIKTKSNFNDSFSQMNNSCSICGQSINNNNHSLIQSPDGKILFYPSKQCLNYNNINNNFYNNSKLNFAEYNNLNKNGKNKNINLDDEDNISTSQLLDLIEKYPQNFQNLEEKLLEIGAESFLRNPEGFEYLKKLIDEAENNKTLKENIKDYQLKEPLRKKILSGGIDSNKKINNTDTNNFSISPIKIIELIKKNPGKYDNLKKLLLEKGIQFYINTPEGKKDIKELIEIIYSNNDDRKSGEDYNEFDKNNINKIAIIDSDVYIDDNNNSINNNNYRKGNINNMGQIYKNRNNYNMNNNNLSNSHINNNSNTYNNENNNDNNGFENTNGNEFGINSINNNINANNNDYEQNNKDLNYIESGNYQNFQSDQNQNNNSILYKTRNNILRGKNDINNLKGELFTIQEAEELEELYPEFDFEYECIGNKKIVKTIKKKVNKKEYPEGRGSNFSRSNKKNKKSRIKKSGKSCNRH